MKMALISEMSGSIPVKRWLCCSVHYALSLRNIHEKELMQFLDSDHCNAYMQSKCLPEQRQKIQISYPIRKWRKLKQAMDEHYYKYLRLLITQ